MKFTIVKIAILYFTALFAFTKVDAQEVLGDCSITYSIEKVSDSSQETVMERRTFYSGAKFRSDFLGKEYRQTTIVDDKSKIATIFKEIGSDRYVTILDSIQWKKCNKKFEKSKTTISNEEKTILGYRCKKATIEFQNGDISVVYFTVDVQPSIKENKYEFKSIPGFILENTIVSSENTLKYYSIAKSINLMPLSSTIFEPSVRGFRRLPSEY